MAKPSVKVRLTGQQVAALLGDTAAQYPHPEGRDGLKADQEYLVSISCRFDGPLMRDFKRRVGTVTGSGLPAHECLQTPELERLPAQLDDLQRRGAPCERLQIHVVFARQPVLT